jgi:predicted ArsR family transcriptional regulator
VRLSGNGDRGLILAQLCYWFGDGASGRTRASINRDASWWVAKTYGELARETGLAPRKVRSSVNFLERLGLLEGETHVFRGRPAVHYRFNYAAFNEAWEAQETEWWEQQANRPSEN